MELAFVLGSGTSFSTFKGLGIVTGWWKYKSVPMRPLYADIPVYRPVIKTPSPEQELQLWKTIKKNWKQKKQILNKKWDE